MRFSVFTNEQELLKAIIEIHCPLGIHCDPMYFKGNFYKEIPQPFHRSDLNPLEGIDCSMADARKLPYENNYLNSIILDPPPFYVRNTRKNKRILFKSYTWNI